jgi:hypothetical protein
MTEFKIKPIKEVLITDLVQDDLENFLYTCRLVNIPSGIWVEGLILVLFTAERSEKNTERHFEGVRLYEKVIFVKLPKYSKSVKWNGGNFELGLRNYKNFPRFVKLAKWIKTQPVWDETPEARA